MFYFEKINNKKILKSDFIENAFFTTKESIIKTKDSSYLKLAIKNQKEIKEFLNIKDFISPIQCHTANVEIVNKKTEYPNTDGLILTKKEMAIFLNFADCTPLVFYDNQKNLGAIAHAGWRGTAEKIGVITVEKMIKVGCNPKDIAVVIGPCISKCCFEVGIDVYEKLYKTINKTYKNSSNDKFFADLKEINKIQLQNIGIEKIDICPYCTVCDNDLFFSYRKENATTNRHSAVLYLK